MTQIKLTASEELERIHLRFLKVPDNKKLSEILGKLLPGILSIYFEADLENLAVESLKDNKKFKALEEVVNHLMMKTTNSKGEVKIPFSKLIDILHGDQFLSFSNPHVKAHGKNRIFDFVFAQYGYLEKDLSLDMENIFVPILKTLPKLDDNSQEKCMLFVLMMHRLVSYLKMKNGEIRKLIGFIQKEFSSSLSKDTHLQEMKSCFYNFICTFQHPDNCPASMGPLIQNFNQCLQFMHQTFKDTANPLDDTWSNCITSCLQAIFSFLTDRELIPLQDSIPLLLLLAQSQFGTIKEEAEAFIKSYLQEHDRNDQSLVRNILGLLQNKNLFKQEPQDHQMLAEGVNDDKDLPPLAKKSIMEFLLKFDCAANSEIASLLALVDKCISDHKTYLQYALKLLIHAIKTSKSVFEPGIEGGFDTVQQIKFLLIKIRNLENTDTENVLVQLSQAEVYVCLADLAKHDYEKIFNQSLSISMLAIEVFEKLILRVNEINKVKPIREDDLCLILMHALNKLRDIIEQHQAKDAMIQAEKAILLNKVQKILNQALSNLNQTDLSQNELIYLLFLYMASLDKHIDTNTGQDVPNPKTLIYSIQLKEHEDIKIRKEAQRQLEVFAVLEAKKQSNILPELMEEVRHFFERNQIMIFGTAESLEENLQYTQGTAFQNKHYTPHFIAQCLEITRFTIKFFEQEFSSLDMDDKDACKDMIERQLLMNLNQNFFTLKSDFIEPLELINVYMQHSDSFEIVTKVGSSIIYKLIKKTVNLDQNIQAVKILQKILFSMNDHEKLNYLHHNNIKPCSVNLSDVKIGHEAKIYALMETTLCSMVGEYQAEAQEWIKTEIRDARQKHSKAITPNLQEEIRMLAVCVSLLRNVDESVFFETSELILEVLENKSLSTAVKFRVSLLESMSKIIPSLSQKKIKHFVLLVFSLFYNKEFDADSQTGAGSLISQAVAALEDEDNLQQIVEGLYIKMIKSRDASIDWNMWLDDISMNENLSDEAKGTFKVGLTSRRNCVVYLNEALQKFGKKSGFIQDRFVEIQKIFLKYIFDKKPQICDISSKALTLIYKTGNDQVKNSLVQSLSTTLTGDEKSQQQIGGETNEDKDEDRELLLDFHDQSSTEQRKKLKTYKDLCKIAVEIGHKEMIYQFMEVHRHLSHYQDIKKAAQGLSNIIMLDERLKADLMKITPKILMLTYDYNDEVRDTMRQLWSTLIDVDKEQQIIDDKFQEIVKEALSYMKQKEFRKRLSACLVLQDLMPNRGWRDIKPFFKELFLGTLALLDDDIDAVKNAAATLAKTNRRLTMNLANIYSNNNLEELQEVLAMVIPMTIDEVIKSNIKDVKFYGVNLLFEIVKSSTQEKMYQSLKIQNKYERQIAFNYNSEVKMKQILNQYLDKITIEVLQNLSQMNQAVEAINRIENYAIDKGIYSASGSGIARNQISEHELNNMRIKYTQDSEWGEILTICRKQMEESTFDKILPELLNLMIKGHDLVTKSTAVTFVKDIILENKQNLIKPQNSKKIAQKLIDIYSHNAVSTCLQLKQSLVNIYASCMGLQFKILQAFPQTTQSLVQQIIQLPDELEVIKTINLYEVMKCLPNELLKTGGIDGKMLMGDALPMFYINRYKTSDQQLKALSERVMRYLKDALTEAEGISPNIELENSEEIFKKIYSLLDSNNYDDRISAGLAMEDLSMKMQSYDLGSSPQVLLNIEKMFQLLSGKYFNNKETLISSFTRLMQLMEHECPWSKDHSFYQQFIQVCTKQIDKFASSNIGYKNKITECLINCLQTNTKYSENLIQPTQLILSQLHQNLETISSNTSMFDSEKFSSFDEKKEEDKQTLESVRLAGNYFSTVWAFIQENNQLKSHILQEFEKYYSITNFLVRNAILKCLVTVLKANKEQMPSDIAKLCCYIMIQTAKCGEKYDINLEQISELTLIMVSSDLNASVDGPAKEAAASILEILKEKGGDNLLKNIDVIRKHLD